MDIDKMVAEAQARIHKSINESAKKHLAEMKENVEEARKRLLPPIQEKESNAN